MLNRLERRARGREPRSLVLSKPGGERGRRTMLRLLATGLALLAMLAAPVSGQGPKGEAEVDELFRRGEELRKAGKLKEAVLAHEKAVEKARAVYGENDRNTAALMDNLARLC